MKRFYVMLMVVLFVMGVVFGISLDNVLAKDSRPVPQRYYKSIQIEEGDSLWSLAEEYRDSQMPAAEYVEELRSMNGLTSDTIHWGQYLTVLYFQ